MTEAAGPSRAGGLAADPALDGPGHAGHLKALTPLGTPSPVGPS